ncbi:hypothetical protein KP509_14G085000 [Ceratopteris richardii]|nr:hypothetical protein KP509_14G085000 [Ceratopteris richardii]
METINVSELMSGLDEDAEPSFQSRSLFAAIPKSKSTAASPRQLSAKLSLDAFTLDPSDGMIRPPTEPTTLKLVHRKHAKSSVLSLEDPVRHTSTSSTTSNRSNVIPSSESSPSEDVSGFSNYLSDSLADDMQRSASFKLFNSQNKGSLGHEDDELQAAVSTETSSSHNLAEYDSVSKSSSNPISSTSSKIKKWFAVNKGALRLTNALLGGGKQDRVSKKLPNTSRSTPPRDRRSSDSGFEGAVSRKGSESGTSCKLSESGSSRRTSDEFVEPNSEVININTGSDRNRVMEVGQGGATRRYRHSFSTGNQSRGSTEASHAGVNRPSSWELEKVVTDGGSKAVLYTTNLQTDINAYEDSNAARAILISLVGAAFDEKSVSQNPAFEQELKVALNLPVVAVPTIYIRGKYIAGIDNIMQFFKKGLLSALLLESLPHVLKPNAPCMCRGGKFLICPVCRGKRKLIRQGEDPVSCRHCSGTGLLKCPNCPKQ